MNAYPNWLSPDQIKMEDILEILDQEISIDDLDFASALIQQVPVYDAPSLVRQFDSDPTGRTLRAAQSEWKWVWDSGPGILVFRQAFAVAEVLDQATDLFDQIVAHVDMPLESGPTLYLPHSQKYPLGYLLADHEPFHDYFNHKRIQLPLVKGDLVMFNPALLHAAGSNTSRDIKRVANLLQISSPFARAMESVDRYRVINTLYPVIVS